MSNHSSRWISLAEISHLLGAELKGDPHCKVKGIASLDLAEKDHLSFLVSEKYLTLLKNCRASAILTTENFAQQCPNNVIIVDDPRLASAKLATLFSAQVSVEPANVHPSLVQGLGCLIAENVAIGPFCVIGHSVRIEKGVIIGSNVNIGNNVSIASNTEIHSNVVIGDGVSLGSKCAIKSGAVIGQDGFGYVQEKSGQWFKIPHMGTVKIGERVQIGNNTCVDRGSLNDTCLEDDVIIDNLVQIGHNVVIGKRTAIAGCVAIAGSAKIGQDCLIGGCSSIAGHLEIADKVHLTATSSVNRSIKISGVYSSGFPAKPNEKWRKNVARFQSLDKLHLRVKNLENKLELND